MQFTKEKLFNNALKLTCSSAFFYFAYLMIVITLQYVPIDFGAAFLAVKEEEIKLPLYQIAFFTHVYISIFVLIIGFFQFIYNLRKLFLPLHKVLGKIYIVLTLLFAAPSGLVMGYYGNGGTYSKISFCLLAILWFCFTLQAYLAVRNKQFHRHEMYMILSYALTLSAISLRLFKWLIVHTLELPPMDTYKIVVWLGWLFNLCIALLIIRHKKLYD
jgi:uncharacterized membrane protein